MTQSLLRSAGCSDRVRDELDNQVITVRELREGVAGSKSSESPPAEDTKEELTLKRKQIGDEFYREAEAESEGEARIVKLTTSIITVSADSLEAIPTSVLASSNKTPTIVSTQAFLASSLESELNQKLQEQILSDGSSSSPSPPRQSPEQDFPPEISVADQTSHALHSSDIFHQDLSGHTVQQGPEGKNSREAVIIIMRYMNFLLGQPLDLRPLQNLFVPSRQTKLFYIELCNPCPMLTAAGVWSLFNKLETL